MPDINLNVGGVGEVVATIEPDVGTPTEDFIAMSQKWVLLDDLLAGSQAMRDRSATWLPMEEKEAELRYRERVDRSYLFNAYRDTVKRIVSRPFSKPVSLDEAETLSEQLSTIENDVDREGKTLSQLGKELFWDGTVYGMCHVLVDFPVVDTDIENAAPADQLTLEDDRKLKRRPTFVRISPQQIIGWRSENRQGVDVLTQVRIYELVTEDDGLYGVKKVEQVRLVTPTSWQLFRKSGEDDKWLPYGLEHPHTFGSIPLFTCYLDQRGVLMAEPPLYDLADLNLAHYQSMSDQRNILRYARTAILFAPGITEDEAAKGVTVGPGQFYWSENKDADLKYVEHSGKAIEAGRQDLLDIEDRMQVIGLQPFVSRTGRQTATGKAIDEANNLTDIQAWIRCLENMLVECYEAAAQWVAEELPEKFAVDIFNEFGLGLRSQEEIKDLIESRDKKLISQETFLTECRKRGLLDETLDVKEEMARLEAEAVTNLSLMAGTPDDDDDDDTPPGDVPPDDEGNKPDEE